MNWLDPTSRIKSGSIKVESVKRRSGPKRKLLVSVREKENSDPQFILGKKKTSEKEHKLSEKCIKNDRVSIELKDLFNALQ